MGGGFWNVGAMDGAVETTGMYLRGAPSPIPETTSHQRPEEKTQGSFSFFKLQARPNNRLTFPIKRLRKLSRSSPNSS